MCTETTADQSMEHVRGASSDDRELPGDLEAFIIDDNHRRRHESIDDLTPADVHFGRGQPILTERERINSIDGKYTEQNLCLFECALPGLPSVRHNDGRPRFVFSARALALLIYLVATPLLAQQAPYTPKPDSPERKAIFDAMRSLGDIHTRVFVVKYLKVADGWAWMIGDPQSPDGVNHFETERALLHKDGDGWRVMAEPCGEEDCDWDKEMARIRKSFPQAPAGIFPPTEEASTEEASTGEASSRRLSECSLIVDGKRFISGPCEFSPRSGGSFMIMKGRRFAVVDLDRPNERGAGVLEREPFIISRGKPTRDIATSWRMLVK